VTLVGPATVAPHQVEEGRWRSMASLYATLMRTAVIDHLQYKVAAYFYMIGMVAEPVIYLVVWETVAREQGGSVAGYTPGTFAAYYIVWTLVRNMNIVFTPYGWEWRIREGQLSGQLLKPVHPIHYDLGWFAGWKVVVVVLWLPIAAFLVLIFRPTLSPTPAMVVTFAIAIWGAYVLRSLYMWMLGMVTFWTTRVSALFELVWVIEMLLSGRIVPLALLPGWAQAISWLLPFRWTFGFPITALVGPIDGQELLVGLGMQLAWIIVFAIVVSRFWRVSVRRYTAVGG
jgi:viologen exporter family transport system permease protein